MNKLFFLFFLFFACDQVYLPKQKAFFAHQFPSPNYILSYNNEKKICNYSFQINELSEIKFDKKCNSIIKYKLLNSKLKFGFQFLRETVFSNLNLLPNKDTFWFAAKLL